MVVVASGLICSAIAQEILAQSLRWSILTYRQKRPPKKPTQLISPPKSVKKNQTILGQTFIFGDVGFKHRMHHKSSPDGWLMCCIKEYIIRSNQLVVSRVLSVKIDRAFRLVNPATFRYLSRCLRKSDRSSYQYVFFRHHRGSKYPHCEHTHSASCKEIDKSQVKAPSCNPRS